MAVRPTSYIAYHVLRLTRAKDVDAPAFVNDNWLSCNCISYSVYQQQARWFTNSMVEDNCLLKGEPVLSGTYVPKFWKTCRLQHQSGRWNQYRTRVWRKGDMLRRLLYYYTPDIAKNVFKL